ncbi:MAG: YbhN family protein [Flavobacteriia bacterium]|jgi:uncharacterized protein (TIRG00374 family)
MSESNFQSAFSSWKIWLAVLLGLGFAVYMLFNSLNEVHFIEVKDKSGTHIWLDNNHNSKVDFSDLNEFQANKNGTFRQKTSLEFISEIKWTSQAFVFLFLAIIFMIGRDLAYMWRIRVLTSEKLSWKKSFYVIMMWEFASALAPGVASGSTVAMFILNKEKIPLGKSTAIVIITTMMDNLFYILMIPLVFIFIPASDLFPSDTTLDKGIAYVFWTGYSIFLVICLLLFTSIFFYPKLIKNFLALIFSVPFLKKWKANAIHTGEEVELTSKAFKKENFSFWFKSFGATILSWTSRFLVINCILAAFISLNFHNHIFILGKQFVLWLFMRISPTPGGSGVAEYAFGELMSDFSHSAFLITALAILWRLISYFPYLLIGAFILPRWLKRK